MTANIMAVAVLVWLAGNFTYAVAQATKREGTVGYVVGALGLLAAVICAVIHLASHLAWHP